ncbi:MAG TPA: hypothetical protein VGH79_05860 [Gaiellaceae bacterium]|jgi:predicted lipoprotein with Yx(FWY)xxD motif
MLKRIAIVSIVVTLVVSGAAFAAAMSGTKVTLHSTKFGKVLASSSGRTLYFYTPETKTNILCTGSCAQTWPPLMTSAKPKAGTGVKQSLLGTAKRSNGKLQVTYHGHPVYRYLGDKSAGAANGEGFQGSWFVLKASGKQG